MRKGSLVHNVPQTVIVVFPLYLYIFFYLMISCIFIDTQLIMKGAVALLESLQYQYQ